MQEKPRPASATEEDEEITGVVEEVFVGRTLLRLEDILHMDEESTLIVLVESVEMYEVIAGMGLDRIRNKNAIVNTKYKNMDKKVKPEAGPLPANNERKRKEVSEHPSLHKSVDIEHTFMEESVEKSRIGGKELLLLQKKNWFWKMRKGHMNVFVFSPNEIDCVDPKIVEPKVIFTIYHMPLSCGHTHTR